MSPVRFYHFLKRWANDFKVLLLSNVPVSLTIEIKIAHVGAIHFADDLTMLLDFTPHIISTLLDSNRILGSDAIGLIREVASSAEVMHQCSPQTIQKLVLMWRVRNFTSILERYRLSTNNYQIDRVHVDTCRELRVARPVIQMVGAFNIDVRNRWMMADLLEMHRGSISHLALEGFAKDGVEWFVEDMAGV